MVGQNLVIIADSKSLRIKPIDKIYPTGGIVDGNLIREELRVAKKPFYRFGNSSLKDTMSACNPCKDVIRGES